MDDDDLVVMFYSISVISGQWKDALRNEVFSNDFVQNLQCDSSLSSVIQICKPSELRHTDTLFVNSIE